TIAALKSKAELADYIAKQHLRSRTSVLFGFGSNQDFGDATSVIAFASAAGLGLPDRDYYTKTDAKSVETRQKYIEHVQRIFELLGETEAAARSDAAIVLSIETALAKPALTRVEKRDPYKIYHKMALRQLQGLTPSFRWAQYLAVAGLS